MNHRTIGLLISLLLGYSLSGWTQQLPPKGAIDLRMEQFGLTDVQELAPEIQLDLRYTTENNFTKQILYRGLSRAYFVSSFAQRLSKAQQLLSQKYPGYHFVIFDASRPLSVQRIMYATVHNTPLKIYVANGDRGGRHNYGVAVDLSIADDQGVLLDMGTDFDHFGIEAHTNQEENLVRTKKITRQAQQNRQLLRSILKQVGMRCYNKEWWHFQEEIPMYEVRKRYKILNF